MSTNPSDDPRIARPAILGLLPDWRWVVGIGIAVTALGIVALAHIVASTVASAFLVALLMIGTGIVQAFGALGASGLGRKALWLAASLLYLFAGVLFIADPIRASAILTLVLAVALGGAGVARIMFGVRLRPARGWVYMLASGVVTAIVALLIVIGWPATIWVLGFVLAFDILSQGLAYIVLGLARRNGTL